MTLYGYARISTVDQSSNSSLDHQKSLLISHGILEHNIYIEVGSGLNFDNRPKLAELTENVMKSGDILVVAKLDRFSRKMLPLLFKVNTLYEKGCYFHYLDCPFVSTDWTSSHHQLITAVIAFIGQVEIEGRQDRIKAGIARAKANHLYTGRKSKCTPKLIAEVEDLRARGVKMHQICKALSIGKNLYYKIVKKLIVSENTKLQI